MSGNDSVPGLFWPGFAQPGLPLAPGGGGGGSVPLLPGISTVLGGNDFVPGFAWPGYMVPGQPIVGQSISPSSGSAYTYSGPLLTAVFPQYFNAASKQVLIANTGSAYTMIAVNGNLAPAIPPNDDADWH